MGGHGEGAIVTLTMNPAIDVNTSVDYVVSDQKLRCAAPRQDPGGGGVNVARAIRRFGGEAVAVFPCGGPPGELLKRLLDDEGVVHVPLPISGSTRENVNVFESVTGRHYRFCMPGPVLTEPEWTACLERIGGMRTPPRWIVASGTLPPGVPSDFYARLAELSRQIGARLALDTSGEPLRLALGAGVHLVKPSLHEFQELTGRSHEDADRLHQEARALITRGACKAVVLSLGKGGAFWTDASGGERLAAPTVAALSAVGAGDSMLGGIVYRLARGDALAEAARFGVAAGAAAVMNPGTELCRIEDVERLRTQVGAADSGRP
jgi:6-phosphofructokinase 2